MLPISEVLDFALFVYILYDVLRIGPKPQNTHIYFIYMYTLNRKPEDSLLVFNTCYFYYALPEVKRCVIFYLLHLEHLEPHTFRVGCSARPHCHGGKEAGRLTQGHPGSTGIRVDPEREPGKDDNQQGWCINTHHVKSNLSSQGEDDLHASVVACQRQRRDRYEGYTHTESRHKDLQGTEYFYPWKSQKVNTAKGSSLVGDIL